MVDPIKIQAGQMKYLWLGFDQEGSGQSNGTEGAKLGVARLEPRSRQH